MFHNVHHIPHSIEQAHVPKSDRIPRACVPYHLAFLCIHPVSYTHLARLSWTFEEVDAKLKDIMENIFRTVSDTAMEYGLGKNYMAGANIAGFIKVADSMIDQGIV